MTRVSKTTPEDQLFILQRSGSGKWYVKKYVKPTITQYKAQTYRRVKIAAMLSEGKKGLSPLEIPWQAYYVKLLGMNRPIGRTERRKWVQSLPPEVAKKVKEVLGLEK
ncbi:hypothetical protein [Thermofilum sp.]|uniref:hypothetical protein n=1 Tax=Thermofilum sp. TaxID=1961369 RepID=UPI00317556C1